MSRTYTEDFAGLAFHVYLRKFESAQGFDVCRTECGEGTALLQLLDRGLEQRNWVLALQREVQRAQPLVEVVVANHFSLCLNLHV